MQQDDKETVTLPKPSNVDVDELKKSRRRRRERLRKYKERYLDLLKKSVEGTLLDPFEIAELEHRENRLLVRAECIKQRHATAMIDYATIGNLETKKLQFRKITENCLEKSVEGVSSYDMTSKHELCMQQQLQRHTYQLRIHQKYMLRISQRQLVPFYWTLQKMQLF